MNANGHASRNEEFDDERWSPPTEAEQKVIEARRERNNKISSLMGQYLLKGYKMLATTCSLCDCVLLEDRQKQKYCIGCMEVDADTKKDNPAVSEHAARRTVEESQHRNTMEVAGGHVEILLSSNSLCGPTSSEVDTLVVEAADTSYGKSNQLNTSALHHLENPIPKVVWEQNLNLLSSNLKGIDDTLKILISKLSWASNKLQTTTDIQQCSHLVKLINEIINTIKNVGDFHKT